MILFSTAAYPGLSAGQAARIMAGLGVEAVELSAGETAPGLLEELQQLAPELYLQPHNYFPPPVEPFVLNLASPDELIAARSIALLEEGIRLSASLGRSLFSIHAGYLFDPEPVELGGRMIRRSLMERNRGMELFLERLHSLAAVADNHGIKLLVENNPLCRFHMDTFFDNPFLMVDAEEIETVMLETPDNVGLLADFGHLKVSASTAGFGADEWIMRLNPWIGGYHLSENDGKTDQHLPIREDSWFLPFLRREIGYMTVELRHLDAVIVKGQSAILEGRPV